MLSKIDIKKLPRAALLAAAMWPLVSCVGGHGLIEDAPSVEVGVAGVESEAQLISQLRSLGYDDIRVTEFYPNRIDPRPELRHGFRSADDEGAQVTPAHIGWNGTAAKNGRTVDVYVKRAPRG